MRVFRRKPFLCAVMRIRAFDARKMVFQSPTKIVSFEYKSSYPFCRKPMPKSDLYQSCKTCWQPLVVRMKTVSSTLFLLLRGASSAGAIHPNRDGINRADGQDEFQPPCTIGFRSLSPNLLARSIDRYHVAAGHGVRPGERTVTIALRLKAQRTFVFHNVADEPSTFDESKATGYRAGECGRAEDDDCRLYRLVERDIKRCPISFLPNNANA